MKNLRRRFRCKFDLHQSERKSSQVNASARKPWPNGFASRPKFSTCVYLRVRLVRTLLTMAIGSKNCATFSFNQKTFDSLVTRLHSFSRVLYVAYKYFFRVMIRSQNQGSHSSQSQRTHNTMNQSKLEVIT